jgi:hypothetical protein
MKNANKLFGIIVLVAVIGLSITGCGDSFGDEKHLNKVKLFLGSNYSGGYKSVEEFDKIETITEVDINGYGYLSVVATPKKSHFSCRWYKNGSFLSTSGRGVSASSTQAGGAGINLRNWNMYNSEKISVGDKLKVEWDFAENASGDKKVTVTSSEVTVIE